MVRITARQRCPAREKLKLIEKYRKNAKQKKTVQTFVCIKTHVDFMDPTIYSLGYENQDTDSHTFTSGQSKVQSDHAEGPLIGDHETKESEDGEADLHQYFNCKKNPGHREFIPVYTFSKKHLPEGFQDNVLYDLIKATADLTVRVNVTISSQRRPKFWPETTEPYPFSNMSKRSNLRTGSGRVRDVNKYQDGKIQDGGFGFNAYTRCWCRKCEVSDSPSNVWWEFDVSTATHVVFDDIEANHTTLRLFYDKYESEVVNVDKVSVVDVNIKYDSCCLKCVTCDKNVGNILMEMFKNFKNSWGKVWNNYTDSRPKHKLTFIVSHPHGCSKQVSVGQWTNIRNMGRRVQLIYTTSTCPGSSGAYVHCLGCEDWTWSELVHSGSFKSGSNYSAVGYLFC